MFRLRPLFSRHRENMKQRIIRRSAKRAMRSNLRRGARWGIWRG